MAVALCLTSAVRAEESPGAPIGDTASALPGIARVGIPGTGPARFAAAGTLGYGFTEAQSAADGAHHRVSGTAAVAVAPVPALELGLRFDERYDHHPDDGRGAHGTFIGDPRLSVRAGKAFDAFRLGAEVQAWVPGKSAPSLAFDATTVDLAALAAFVPKSGPRFAIRAGYRLGDGAKAAPDPTRLRFGDRLALGLSQFDAVLAGLGVSYPLGRTEILGEVSSDILVGTGAPGVVDSPIRVTAGVRHGLSSALALEVLAEVSPSGRPNLGANAPFVPVEPRASLLAGLRYRLPFGSTEPATTEREPAPAPSTAPPPAPTPTTASFVLKVSGPDGPIEGANIEVHAGDVTRQGQTAADGTFQIEGIPPGDAKVVVTAEGFATVEQNTRLDGGKGPDLALALTPTGPAGEIRGLVRSFGGKGLGASVRVDPLGVEAKTDSEGAFTLAVPPGDYEVTIHAERFKEQRRKIHVDKNGVTILNVELFEAKR